MSDKPWHAHECKSCGNRWQHERCDTCSDAEYAALHDCPKCGRNERDKLRIGGQSNFDHPPLPTPLDMLRYHVSGAIERGEKQPIAAKDE